MSFTFDVIVNPIILAAAITGGGIIGFVWGKTKLAKSRSRIQHLETELMRSNEETLDAQRACVLLEGRLNDQSIPVIPMKINAGKENNKEKISK
jgi:hypothetical protein